jgi:hypothetical protein
MSVPGYDGASPYKLAFHRIHERSPRTIPFLLARYSATHCWTWSPDLACIHPSSIPDFVGDSRRIAHAPNGISHQVVRDKDLQFSFQRGRMYSRRSLATASYHTMLFSCFKVVGFFISTSHSSSSQLALVFGSRRTLSCASC